MNRFSLFTRQALALVLIFLLSACVEEPIGGNDLTGKGHTVTLRLAATVAPVPETKAIVLPARAGSEAEAAGFRYEMVSSDAAAKTPGLSIDILPIRKDSTDVNFTPEALATKSLATKAPSKLKNVHGFLFTKAGAFNGHAYLEAYTVGAATDITFTEVVTPKADDCRLVIVVNDAAAGIPYASSTDFAGFKGTYTDFQNLTLTSKVSRDEDVPYAGSATVNLSQSETGATVDLEVYRILAKVTLENTFAITGGPGRSNITLHNAGTPRFAPSGANNYDGTGTTQTTSGFIETTPGGNVNSITWYVGENIQPTIASIKTPADRNRKNAPEKACYIRISSAALPIPKNTTPTIGQEYTQGGDKSFTYDLYLGKSSELSNFALRRNTNYTLASEISGTLVEQEQLAAEDGRVTLTRPEPMGLAIGYFGGPDGYSTTGGANKIKGSYTKMLLLEPNTSRSTAPDNKMGVWGVAGTQYQEEVRMYWDKTYIYGITTDGTVGGMSTAEGGVYAYCHKLTLGGVPEGTWYVPTEAQMLSMWTIQGGLKSGNFGCYSAFTASAYWCSNEYRRDSSWYVGVNTNGGSYGDPKSNRRAVRCVMDSPSTETASQYVTEVNGYPVIDLSELSPLGCVLTAAQAITRCREINSQTPSNKAFLPIGYSASGEKGIWNAKMSPRFQVMRENLPQTDWASAYDACKEYEGEEGKAGEWRLPTQRELAMIWVLHPQLISKGGITELDNYYYHSCTEYSATNAWHGDIGSGNFGYNGHPKTHDSLYVRCVRDLQ